MVYNDGYRDGVYATAVGVDEPSSINWLNLSEPVFTLRPGQSKLVYFTFNVTSEAALSGEHDFIFTPTLLTTSVEPYLDTFANYVSSVDSFRFRLNVSRAACRRFHGHTYSLHATRAVQTWSSTRRRRTPIRW